MKIIFTEQCNRFQCLWKITRHLFPNCTFKIRFNRTEQLVIIRSIHTVFVLHMKTGCLVNVFSLTNCQTRVFELDYGIEKISLFVAAGQKGIISVSFWDSIILVMKICISKQDQEFHYLSLNMQIRSAELHFTGKSGKRDK